MQHRISGVHSLNRNGQRQSGTRGRTRGGIRPPKGHEGLRLPYGIRHGMRHPAEIQVLQGRGERRRTQVTNGAITMVELGIAMSGVMFIIMPGVGVDVMRAVAAIVQEGSRQCQEAHRNDEQTCEI